MIIYLVTNTVNGKRYVGQTVKPLHKRWLDHIRKSRLIATRMALHSAIRKYGSDSFTIQEIAKGTSLEDLNRLEIEYIRSLKTLAPNGYNLSQGGRKKLTKYQCKMISSGIRNSSKCKAMWKKRSGEGHALSKLSWDDIAEIRTAFFKPEGSSSYLATKYGVTPENIMSIVHGNTWKKSDWIPSKDEIEQASLMHLRNKVVRGEDHHNAKLTLEIVKKIRSHYLSGGYTTKQLAEMFSVDSNVIKLILKNRLWRNSEWEESRGLVAERASKNRKLKKPNRLKLSQDLAEKIRELRYSMGYSYSKISGLSNVSESVVKKFFRGCHPYYPDERTNIGKIDARFKQPIRQS
jgi:group I intron endonuclease